MYLEELSSLISSGRRCHLTGIGGISMSPLAEILHGRGVFVSGSDVHESDTVRKLRSLGIDVTIGQSAENVRDAGLIIRTAAAGEDNAEIIAARQTGIPVFERAQAWGLIMRDFKNAVCVAGVHGKTTTTSILFSAPVWTSLKEKPIPFMIGFKNTKNSILTSFSINSADLYRSLLLNFSLIVS